ncbi:hypothetical protein POM88_028565 [Heracleum sosnowskyi]|uniref:Uncharacterized protein n=1 Tax=Heracleum sosnowskyi TaxID=360622 RepID=A0AAD8HTV0_9APIA|nr:hypothetical protein POM88_028565 [Heracleum sosnowskyi]
MNTPSRAQTTVAGTKSGGKIVKRRRYAVKTPYGRSRPRHSPKNTGRKWLTGDFLSDTSRIIAKGAMKFLTFMTDTDYISSSESEDEDDVVSCDDDDVYATSEVSKWKEKDITLTEMIQICPKWVIAKLLPRETFSREESEKLIKIINSRAVDYFSMGVEQNASLMETPSGRSGTHDRCSKAVMQEKHRSEEKKKEISSKSNMVHGLSAFGSVPLQHSGDMVRSYMQACPPWASPSLRPSGLRTPSPLATDLSKDRVTSTSGGSSFPSAQKRGILSARSWSIQDEVRKVRSKAAEDMLHALPSKRNDLLVVSEHKSSENSIVPGGGSTVDQMHLSKFLPEKEHVGPSTIHDSQGPSTIHDSKDSFALGLKQDGMQAEPLSSNPSSSVSEPNQHLIVEGATTTDSYHSVSLEHLVKQHNESDTNTKDGITRRYDLRNSVAPDANSLASLRSSLRLRLSAGIEHNHKQSNSRRNR